MGLRLVLERATALCLPSLVGCHGFAYGLIACKCRRHLYLSFRAAPSRRRVIVGIVVLGQLFARPFLLQRCFSPKSPSVSWPESSSCQCSDSPLQFAFSLPSAKPSTVCHWRCCPLPPRTRFVCLRHVLVGRPRLCAPSRMMMSAKSITTVESVCVSSLWRRGTDAGRWGGGGGASACDDGCRRWRETGKTGFWGIVLQRSGYQ